MIICETGLRTANFFRHGLLKTKASEPPLHIVCDCPFLYQLNPDHPDISSQGLRERDYSIPKPENILRILLLGDSVTFGDRVPADCTFAKLLEKKLNRKYGNIEVINTAVNGYTPYNELHYYLNKGRLFQSDIVIIGFCLNDVVDPQLHWNYTKKAIENIPIEGIPNLDYHESNILPLIDLKNKTKKKHVSLLQKSLLFRFIKARLQGIIDPQEPPDEKMYDEFNGKLWPIYLTLEDAISIKVLLDYNSPEWRWLRSMYDELDNAVVKDGAKLIVLLFPLAYQIEKDYPYIPQRLISRHFAEKGISCLDLLPALRQFKSDEVFLRERMNFDDIWHLTKKGHQVVAEELENYLIRYEL